MKKNSLIFTVMLVSLTLVILLIYLPPAALNFQFNLGLLVTITVCAVILTCTFIFGFKVKSSKEIALIAMLGALSAALRIPFAAIPSLNPCTYLITCVGYVFGGIAGFMVGILTPLLSNFILTHGPWTIYQMFAWGLVGLSSSILGKFKVGRFGLSFFGFIWGYIFGLIMNLWFWFFFIYPLTFETLLLVEVRSIWFDSIHAFGNLAFLWFFGLKTIGILERFKKRFTVNPP